MASWYVQRHGKEHGPFSDSQLRGLAAKAELKPDDLLRREDAPAGRPAKELKGLFDQPQAVAPVPATTRPTAPSNRIRAPEDRATPSSLPARRPPFVDEWHYVRGSQQQGPVTFAQLKELARSGQLRSSDLVWQNGTPDWKEARLTDGLFETPVSGTPPPLPNGPSPLPHAEPPALWNPRVAWVLSFFFTFWFGAVVIAKNWKALGNDARARRSMFWFYSLIPWSVVAMLTPRSPGVTRAFWTAGSLTFLAWICLEVRPQTQFLKENYGGKYPRKPWVMPIAICFTVAFAVAGVTAVYQISAESRQEVESMKARQVATTNAMASHDRRMREAIVGNAAHTPSETAIDEAVQQLIAHLAKIDTAEQVVTNPDAPEDVRRKGLDLLIQEHRSLQANLVPWVKMLREVDLKSFNRAQVQYVGQFVSRLGYLERSLPTLISTLEESKNSEDQAFRDASWGTYEQLADELLETLTANR